MPLIQLTKGKFAIVDYEDYKALYRYKWCLNNYGYAVRNDKKRSTVYMHREIMKPIAGQQVDHVNLDKLDNRRSNLRFATDYQNRVNRSVRCDSKLKIKGVRFMPRQKTFGVYQARIKQKHLGYFQTKRQAAEAYNKAAKMLFGEFSYLNKLELIND